MNMLIYKQYIKFVKILKFFLGRLFYVWIHWVNKNKLIVSKEGLDSSKFVAINIVKYKLKMF